MNLFWLFIPGWFLCGYLYIRLYKRFAVLHIGRSSIDYRSAYFLWPVYIWMWVIWITGNALIWLYHKLPE